MNNEVSFMKYFLLIGVLLLTFDTNSLLVSSHSYLTSPISRSNQKQTQTGCRGAQCLGPCDKPLSQKGQVPVISIERGQNIKLEWPRNNHAGGFIRIAWAKTSESDSHSAFDANVQEIVCHERGGCRPDSVNDLNGGDSGPSDGSSRACSASVSVPSHLSDGDWTLQWAWFGGAFALGDYYSCVDYKISGGEDLTSNAMSPIFIGGDFTYPNQQKCKFFSTDRLHHCVNEPCASPLFSGERSGVPFGFSSSSNSNTKLTTGKVSNVQLTTGKVSNNQLTTGKVSNNQLSTGKISNIPLTTGKVVNNIPLTSDSIIPPSTSMCSSDYSFGSQSIASVDSVDTWGNTFRMVIKLSVQESILSNWAIQIIWPSNAQSTRIEAIFNAGILLCEANSPEKHAIIKPTSWSKSLYSGSVSFIEVIATNSNMKKEFIMNNTKFKVLRS